MRSAFHSTVGHDVNRRVTCRAPLGDSMPSTASVCEPAPSEVVNASRGGDGALPPPLLLLLLQGGGATTTTPRRVTVLSTSGMGCCWCAWRSTVRRRTDGGRSRTRLRRETTCPASKRNCTSVTEGMACRARTTSDTGVVGSPDTMRTTRRSMRQPGARRIRPWTGPVTCDDVHSRARSVPALWRYRASAVGCIHAGRSSRSVRSPRGAASGSSRRHG